MLRSIDKKIKIIFYIFLILFLSTFNNTNIHELKKNFFLIEKIKINGLNEKLTLDINYKLEKYLRSNLFLLNKKYLQNDMNEFPFIESYTIKISLSNFTSWPLLYLPSLFGMIESILFLMVENSRYNPKYKDLK